ncbi:hypothetical protein H6P81_010004 [Aristolochia fimbriata]|uniref:Reverse transcriptase domain-containing protein n=1 Tax=Aristolochia fimbriata TaxID=158543 RepID=A0AAV7ENQ2_ARIFI|nr:hypothetical protein H6P81_010004 [Aristolochia fimbriata]
MEILIQEKREGKAPMTEADKKPKFVKKEYKAPAKEALATNVVEPQKITATQNQSTGSNWKPNVNRINGGAPRQKVTLKDKQDRILELATQGRIILETDDNTAASHTIFVQSDSSSRTRNPRTNKKVLIADVERPRPQPATKEKEGWEVVTRKKKLLPKTPVKIFIKGYAAEEPKRRKVQKKRGGRRHKRKSAPAKVEEKIHQRKPRPITLADFFPSEFLTPTSALVATCSLQVVEQRREGKALMGSTDDIHTCLQDLSITNALQDDLDLPIRSRQALIKFVAAKDDWHAKVEQLRMRRHDEPKVGLSPSMLKEEQPVEPPQIKEAHSISISFKEADMLLGERSHNRPLFVSGAIKDRPFTDDPRLQSRRTTSVGDNQTRTTNWGYDFPRVVPHGEEKTVFADECPFTEAEASFADPKYYSEEKVATSSKAIPPKAVKDEQANPKKQPEVPILRYVPQSRRKKGESPFATCDQEEPAEKLKALKGAATIPLPKLKNRGILVEEKQGPPELPKTRTQGFDPNAYRMMAKAGSGFSLKQLQEKSAMVVQNLSPTQKNLQAQGYSIPANRHGLGYQKYERVVISGKASVNQITTKRNAIGVPKPRISAFVRLGQEENRSPNIPSRPSNEDKLKVAKVWQKKGQAEDPKPNPTAPPTTEKLDVFQRLGKPMEQPKKTIFQRLGASTRVPVSQRLVKIRGSSKRIKVESSEVTPAVIYISSKKRDPEEEETVVVHHISAGESDDSTPEDDLGEAPAIFEEGGQATIDQLKKVNLGTEDDSIPTFLSASLSVTEEKDYVYLLSEYKDVFAWSYTEMPGLDPTIAIHKLVVKSVVRPVKQTQRRFRPELVPEIEKEVDKLLKADFIREVKYPSWIANIVPVKKKNGQIRVCVDFRDLNKACPKDDFPLPITELMVDTTTGHKALSFMDGSSGYNQIRMDPKHEEKTAFRMPKGIFCYKVMSFGLKNAGATYQRAMQKIFDDFLHKFVECYVDDLVVRTKSRDDHLKHLRAVFERLRRHQLKMNPLKCAFGVSSGKFLGFVVRHRGIEIDQTKIDAIQQMPEPKTLSELKSLQGHLEYIRRFISKLDGRCQPFSRRMKKDTPFEWDESCQRAFQNIKDYLMKPPVLIAPVPGKPLLLYVAAQEKSLGALLAQNDDQGKERPLYHLSRTMVGAKINYSPIEKTCLALIFAI